MRIALVSQRGRALENFPTSKAYCYKSFPYSRLNVALKAFALIHFSSQRIKGCSFFATAYVSMEVKKVALVLEKVECKNYSWKFLFQTIFSSFWLCARTKLHVHVCNYCEPNFNATLMLDRIKASTEATKLQSTKSQWENFFPSRLLAHLLLLLLCMLFCISGFPVTK